MSGGHDVPLRAKVNATGGWTLYDEIADIIETTQWEDCPALIVPLVQRRIAEALYVAFTEAVTGDVPTWGFPPQRRQHMASQAEAFVRSLVVSTP